MSRPITPCIRIIGLSNENLDDFDELEDVMDEFDRTPRPRPIPHSPLPEVIEVTCANGAEPDLKDEDDLDTPRSETGSILITECNELLPEGQRVPRSRSSTSHSRRTIKSAHSVILSPRSNHEMQQTPTTTIITNPVAEDFALPDDEDTLERKQWIEETISLLRNRKEGTKMGDETALELELIPLKTNAKTVLNRLEDERFVDNLQKVKWLSLCVAIVVVILAITIALVVNSAHIIHEGSVGIYFRNGALMNVYTMPGLHWKTPVITRVVEIDIQLKNLDVPEIEVATSDGIISNFQDVQAIVWVNQKSVLTLVKRYGILFKEVLIFHRISEELRVLCANRTIDDLFIGDHSEITVKIRHNLEARLIKMNVSEDIQVKHLTIPRPNVPSTVKDKYESFQIQWIERLSEVQNRATETILKETENQNAIADANLRKAVSKINTEMELLRIKGAKNVSSINNEIVKVREKNLALVLKYKKNREAESNLKLFKNKGYMDVEMSKKLAKQSKVYFSGKESLLGGIMNEIMNA